MTRVLVTPRSLTAPGAAELVPLVEAGFEVVRAPAGRRPTEEELLALVPGCVGWIAGVEPITRSVLTAAADLRVISRNGAGVDTIDLDAARELGIDVLRAAGANANGVAELVIGLVLAAVRELPAATAAMREGRWERRLGTEVAGRRLGVIGAGAIGRRVAELGRGLGMEPVGTDPFAPADAPMPLVALDELLATADVVTLHCPAPADGRPVIGERELRLMRPGAVLINTARAALVDEQAALAALDDGRLRALATDVYAQEPPAPSPLLSHPRVLATPHIGGYTEESVDRAGSTAVRQLLDALAGADGSDRAR